MLSLLNLATFSHVASVNQYRQALVHAVAVEKRPYSGSSSTIAICQILSMVFTTACFIFTPSSKQLTNPTATFLSVECDHLSTEFRDSASEKAGTRTVIPPMSNIMLLIVWVKYFHC